ncbi:hypothetical protein GCM10017559_53440 [Streptosporangium longisporum]|uniref:HTH cro/C1-type domain-containing protein n=1 Tax=Streptosporangium longisporum TaxID=46187 RepID=A0ABN3Y7H7_9ACTN
MIPDYIFPFDRANIHQLRDFLLNQRKIAGWTQEELAERSGVSVRTIRNLETGTNTNPRRSSVALLLKALGTATASFAEPSTWDHDRPRLLRPHSEPQQSNAPGLPPWRGPHPPHNPLVGRQADMGHILAAAQRNRLTVLTGPGGVGKTRLALTVAARLRPLFLEGVATAELHHCLSEQLGPRAQDELTYLVREMIGADTWLDGEAQAGRRLLILDGAEHVPHQTVHLARRLLDEYPGLHILVTSRRMLTIGEAETWEVEPLPVDDHDFHNGSMAAAVELFLRRTQASLPTLDLGNHLPLVTKLCRLLDGMPLAIEIAARRLRTLPLTSLLQEDTLFHLLGKTDASDLSRHRTLSDSVRWSYDLLSPPHRELLHELVAMPDTFSLEEALATRPNGSERSRVAQLLAELAEASLIQIRRGQQYRYRIYAVVRHFVAQLERRGTSGPDWSLGNDDYCLAVDGAWRPAI